MRKRILLFAIFLLFFEFFMLCQKHPITFNDFYSIKRIKTFDVSKDGKTILFTLKTPLVKENRYNYSIYVVDNTGTHPLLSGSSNNFNPLFSPKNQNIFAFLSDRSGESQIFLYNLRTKKVVKITEFPTGVDSFCWSGDGNSIFFSSTVFKGCNTSEEVEAYKEKMKKRKTTARIIKSLMYRYWDKWINDKISHVYKVDLKTKKAVPVVSGNYWCPPIDLGSIHDFVSSPDGKELAFTSSPLKNKATSTNNDVYVENLTSGEIENITEKNLACDAAPFYSPDGKYISMLSMKRPNFESDKKDIVLYDRENKTFKDLTKNFPNTITDYIWGDENTIFFTCPEKARRPIYKLDITTGKISYVFPSHFNRNLKYNKNSNTLYFMSESINHPIDIYKYDFKLKKMTQITHINDKLLNTLKLSNLHEFYFKGAKGDKVHAIYIYPPEYKEGKKYPVVFLIHGGPQGDFADEFHYRWNAQMFASPGYIVVMINFHGSVGYGQAFTDSVSKHWGGTPYEDIIKGVKFFLEHHPEADEKRIGAAGASFGGFMIDWIEGHTDMFKCLVTHDGPFDQRSMFGSTEELWFPIWEFNGTPWDRGNFYEIYSPSTYVNNFKTPMLVVHSQKDYRVPVTQGFQLFTALQLKGVPSELLYFSDEDHFVQKPQNAKVWWREVLGWLNKYLKKK